MFVPANYRIWEFFVFIFFFKLLFIILDDIGNVLCSNNGCGIIHPFCFNPKTMTAQLPFFKIVMDSTFICFFAYLLIIESMIIFFI